MVSLSKSVIHCNSTKVGVFLSIGQLKYSSFQTQDKIGMDVKVKNFKAEKVFHQIALRLKRPKVEEGGLKAGFIYGH